MLRHRAGAALEFKGAAVRIFGEEGQVVRDELHAHFFVQPVDRGADVLCIERELREVVQVVAVGEEVLHHRIDGVVRRAEGLLELRALSNDLAARNRSGAADEGHLFDENGIETVHAGANRRGHARAAATITTSVVSSFVAAAFLTTTGTSVAGSTPA